MSESEHTCRICRVEASETQPLIHPCKCRGLIKYIHQDCLMQWLEHSNNREKRCDICNTPYRFVTLYDPNMPKHMPISDIYHKLITRGHEAIIKHISAGLYLGCIFQIPVYWKFVGRLCTYAVDGQMPSPSFLLFHVMAYGAYSRTRNGHLFTSPEATSLEKWITFLYNTYLSGTVQVLLFVFVLFVIFIEHEWVVREEGYTKLLLRHIGKEPKTKLSDLLGQILHTRAENGDQQNEEIPATDDTDRARQTMAARALEYIQQDAQMAAPGNNLREALENGFLDEFFQGLREYENEHGPVPRPMDAGNGFDRRDLETETHGNNVPVPVDSSDDEIDAEAQDLTQDLTQDLHQQQEPNLAANIPPANNPVNALNDDSEDETPEELERRRNLEDDEMAVAEAANNNGNIFEVLGLRLQIATPIQLTFLVDAAALLALLVVYFLPHILGSFVAVVFLYVLIGIHGVFVAPFLSLTPVVKLQTELTLFFQLQYWNHPVLLLVRAIILQQFIQPSVKVFYDVTAVQRTEPPSYMARFVFLAIGYIFVCFAVHQLMTALALGGKPIVGASRRIYKVLFQITATSKVFAIFAIEIVFFPVYCGWLVDFCLAPLLVSKLTEIKDSATIYHVFFTTAHLLTLNFIVRFALYWLWGTAYMFCVALFVSMTRSHILRPGVLYFIKSPEDPNARLIHDAIVKPFFLQMLRILLSARVYSAFVVLGIGIVTWGIRFLVNPPWGKGALLPIRQFYIFSYLTAFVTGIILSKCEPVLTKYLRMFWKRSFAVLCHKLRLSHFILGSPVPQERGYVVYRNALDSFLQLGTPDYTKPVSYSEAMEIFKNDPSVSACFVPNGSYVRAPNSDDNSRKFLRGLFVPVTKSDQLLSPVPENDLDDDTDWWDAEVVCEDTYAVVYSPPNIRIRCITLVCMISIFGALLFVVTLVIAIILGRPTFRAWVIVTEYAAKAMGLDMKLSESFDWLLADIDSICIGLVLEVIGLLMLDSSPEGTSIMNFAVEQRRRLAQPAVNIRGFMARAILWLGQRISQIWFTSEVHLSYIAHIEAYLFGTSCIKPDGMYWNLSFTWPGFIMHFLAGFLTIIPIMSTLYSGMPQLGNVKQWAQKVGLIQLFTGMAIILCHKLYQMIYGELVDETDMYARLAVIGLIIFTNVVLKAHSILKGVNEQIKAEKYVRGTAVQNIEISDD